MSSWFYWLCGSETPVAWTTGEPPVGTDFSRAAFLNQFVDRMNARAAVAKFMGDSGDGMARIAAGDYFTAHQDALRESFIRDFFISLSDLSPTSNPCAMSPSSIPEDDDVSLLPLTSSAALASVELAKYSNWDPLSEGECFWAGEQPAWRFSAMRSALDKVRVFGKDLGFLSLTGSARLRHQASGGIYGFDPIDESHYKEDWNSYFNDWASLGWRELLANIHPTDVQNGGAGRYKPLADVDDYYDFLTMHISNPTVDLGVLSSGVAVKTSTYKYGVGRDQQDRTNLKYWSEECPIEHRFYRLTSADARGWLGAGNRLVISLGGGIGVDDITDKTTQSILSNPNPPPYGYDYEGYIIGTAVVIEVDDEAAQYPSS